MALKVLLNGAYGRLGRVIQQVAPLYDVEISAKTGRKTKPDDFIDDCDVVVDVSLPEATLQLTELCINHDIPIVIGTTGHTPSMLKMLHKDAEQIPILHATNFSLGINLLNYLVEKAARSLPPQYQTEIIEAHHRFKLDSPSGTALTLLSIVKEIKDIEKKNITHGREGVINERPDEEIGIHSIRAGDIVGDHKIIFAGPGECIELSHKALDRKIFAQGAINAAKWILGKEPGLYTMRDILHLED